MRGGVDQVESGGTVTKQIRQLLIILISLFLVFFLYTVFRKKVASSNGRSRMQRIMSLKVYSGQKNELAKTIFAV